MVDPMAAQTGLKVASNGALTGRDAAMMRDVAIERIDREARTARTDRVVIEAPLELRARGAAVATVMRTPGDDLELVRGLLHAESLGAPEVAQVGPDAVDIAIEATAFAGRGLLASAACGVCGRVAISDLERRATEVAADTVLSRAVLAELPGRLAGAQRVFADTGGLHGAALCRARDGALLAAREDVGRHNAVDKLVGWAIAERVDPSGLVLVLSGRAGYELVQKAVMLGVPVVASVSAPSSLAIELAERFRIALAGFVRDARCNVYSHAWRITG
jgi:FdhD protein